MIRVDIGYLTNDPTQDDAWAHGVLERAAKHPIQVHLSTAEDGEGECDECAIALAEKCNRGA